MGKCITLNCMRSFSYSFSTVRTQ